MTVREKKMASIIGAVAGVVMVVNFVYPSTIKPLLDIQDELDDLEEDLYEYEEERDEIEKARLTYRDLVIRTGGNDPLKVKNSLHARLEQMADRAKLKSPRITPKKPTRDRKTNLATVQMTISAEGTLKAATEYLKSCYELPYVARFKDVKLSPIKSAKKSSKAKDKKKSSRRSSSSKESDEHVKLSATFEVLVLPEERIAHIDPEDIKQPEQHISYQGDSYAMIWERGPFSEYTPPPAPTPKETKRPEPKEEKKPKKPERPKRPEKKPEPGDPDRKTKRVAATLVKAGKLQVINNKRHTREYVDSGGELDGGELVFVHPYGGIVRKETGYFFYELGGLLKDSVPVTDDGVYPEVLAVAQLLPEVIPPQDPAKTGGDDEPEELPAGDDAESASKEKSDRTKVAAAKKGAAGKGEDDAPDSEAKSSKDKKRSSSRTPRRSPTRRTTGGRDRDSEDPDDKPKASASRSSKPRRVPKGRTPGRPTRGKTKNDSKNKNDRGNGGRDKGNDATDDEDS